MKSRLLSAVCACIFYSTLMSTANAAFVSEVGGQVVYDSDLDIRWIANANLAASNTFGVAGINVDGSMTWDKANEWIDAMNADGGAGYLGFNDWRLPNMDKNGDNVIDDCFSGLAACMDNELRYMRFYGANADNPSAFFSNIQADRYWSGNEYAPDPNFAWFQDYRYTGWAAADKISNEFVWAVRGEGISTSAVPLPTAVWLFGSGLLGLFGVARRKKV